MAAMNMEEWQRKLKAEKDAARKKKTESAEILRGYRGEIKDEDLKLKVLRDEERQKQLDAQNNLHNYKNTQLQESLKPKGQRPEQHYPPPVNAGDAATARDSLEGIVMGSVSERAAAFATTAPEIMEAPTDERQMLSTPVANATGGLGVPTATDDDDDDDDFGPSIAPSSSTFPMDTVAEDPFAAEIPVNDSLVGSVPETTIEPVATHAIGQEVNDPPAMPSTDNPFVAPQASEPAVVIPSTEWEAPSLGSLPAADPVSTVAPPVTNGVSTDTPTWTEALFSFGLVTIRSQPELTSYMKAVQSIVEASSRDGTNQFRYDSDKMPYVKDLQWDASFVSRSGRSDVKRLVVTAAVPIMVLSTTTTSKAKETVVAALQAAIQSGDFLSLAQGN